MIELPERLHQVREDAAELSEQIAAINVAEDLIRTKDLGALSDLSVVGDRIEELHQLMLELGAPNLEELPTSYAAVYRDLARDYLDLKTRIMAHEALGKGDPVRERANLLAAVRACHSRILERSHGLLALRRSQLSIQGLTLSAPDSPMVAELTRLRDEIISLRDDARNAAEAAQTAAGLTGVSSYATIFRRSAEGHVKASWFWLVAGAVLAVGTGAWVVSGFVPLSISATSTPEIISSALAKVVLLSIAGVAVGLAVRNYSAHRHNAVVDRHREYALRTFEAFVEAAPEGPIRDAILLETTRSIFAPAQTGFLGGGGAEGSQGSYIGEVVKSVVSK